MRASGTANHAQPQVELSPQQKFWYGSSASRGFGSLLSELGISGARQSSKTTTATAATALAPAARAQGSSSTAQVATDSAASESSETEAPYTYVAPVKDGINLGPQGSSISQAQAAANQAATLGMWNQASVAEASGRNLTISDYVAPGDSLSNYPAGTTIAQLIQGYSCTVPNMADPNAGEYANTGHVMVNGAAITGMVPDPYGGFAAPLGSTAAALFQAEGGTPKGSFPLSVES